MTETELPLMSIPDEVVHAWCQGADVDLDEARTDIALIAAPVVGAMLRRLTTDRRFRDVQEALNEYADAVDPA